MAQQALRRRDGGRMWGIDYDASRGDGSRRHHKSNKCHIPINAVLVPRQRRTNSQVQQPTQRGKRIPFIPLTFKRLLTEAVDTPRSSSTDRNSLWGGKQLGRPYIGRHWSRTYVTMCVRTCTCRQSQTFEAAQMGLHRIERAPNL
eukprot:GHVU01186996.1.p1 GENE.GHVU01186996.1~~GHVU01186996.1.p1  ORF type:complete len:145 (-),score=8.68 GHVU01186996.1:8-442(-)